MAKTYGIVLWLSITLFCQNILPNDISSLAIDKAARYSANTFLSINIAATDLAARDLYLNRVIITNLIVTLSAVTPLLPQGIQSLNDQYGAIQELVTSDTGTFFTINSVDNVHTFVMPNANNAHVTQGLISNTQVVAYNYSKLTADQATAINSPNTLVKRDLTSSFSAYDITAITALIGNLYGTAQSAITTQTALYLTGPLFQDVRGSQSNTSIVSADGIASGTIAYATTFINTATSYPIANTLVLRDTQSSFSTDTIYCLNNVYLSQTSSSKGQLRINTTPFLHTWNNNVIAGANGGNLIMSATGNTIVGANALQNLNNGYDNIALGSNALKMGTQLTKHIGIGTNIFTNIQPANFPQVGNIGLGHDAATALGTGSTLLNDENIIIGNKTARNLTESQRCILIGAGILQNAIGSLYNTIVVGAQVLVTTTAISNNSIILCVKNNVNDITSSIEGSDNVFCINQVPDSYTFTGTANAVVGNQAFRGVRSGSSNVAIGYVVNGASQNIPCNSSVLIGSGASSTGEITNCVCIGAFVTPISRAVRNTIIFGNASGFLSSNDCINNIYIGSSVGVAGDTGVCRIDNINGNSSLSPNMYINSLNQVFLTVSSEKFKKNITPLTRVDVENILQVQPISYIPKNSHTDYPGESTRFFGFVAEQANEVFPEVVDFDNNHVPIGIQYTEFIAPLVTAYQNLKQVCSTLTTTIAALEMQCNQLTEDITFLETIVQVLEG